MVLLVVLVVVARETRVGLRQRGAVELHPKVVTVETTPQL
jgi:hypothetical protein